MSEEGNMARQHETEIKFTQNWGGKLDLDIFVTSRGQDKIYKVGSVYPVDLVPGIYHKKKHVGHFKLLKIEFKRIRDYTLGEIARDIGHESAGSDPRHNFLEIMRAWYSKKGWWDGEYTVLQQLTLERIGRGGS